MKNNNKTNIPKFEWLPKQHVAFCTLFDKETHKEYVGSAYCHPDDLDMCNEYTGYEIALRRATIEGLKDQRDMALVELKALKQLYYSMSQSKKFNPYSYEYKMLKRQIKIKEEDLAYNRSALENYRTELRSYIQAKDKTYNIVRQNREKGQD